MKLLSEATVLKPPELCPEPPSRGILHFPVVNKNDAVVLLEWEMSEIQGQGLLHRFAPEPHKQVMVASKSHRYLVTLSTCP